MNIHVKDFIPPQSLLVYPKDIYAWAFMWKEKHLLNKWIYFQFLFEVSLLDCEVFSLVAFTFFYLPVWEITRLRDRKRLKLRVNRGLWNELLLGYFWLIIWRFFHYLWRFFLKIFWSPWSRRYDNFESVWKSIQYLKFWEILSRIKHVSC